MLNDNVDVPPVIITEEPYWLTLLALQSSKNMLLLYVTLAVSETLLYDAVKVILAEQVIVVEPTPLLFVIQVKNEEKKYHMIQNERKQSMQKLCILQSPSRIRM